MDDSVLDFYDNLAEAYHLIFVDWNQAIARQGEVLSKIIHAKLADPDQAGYSLLDCSCGIGTQAIGLANHGFQVSGTDLSSVSIERATKEAAAFGVEINFGVADFRSLAQEVSGTFDVVISADNAVPHLLTDEDLYLALSNMYAKVKNDGVLLITIRDYDELAKEKPRATEPRVFDQGKRIVFQVWDWADDGTTYRTNQFILQEINGNWITKHNKTTYRAILREELTAMLMKAGFSEIEWLMPSESGYYQPVVTARK
ncbi:bifunctional 2-polyprenyl-6-hydroxyphenol methylase/3-demethylubiquinol 3-O-methyltransferase UbiG [Paenibacillus sp. BC26]|uniref:class I SAM-dependent methyltransferase n=1 Tax=Paenibacillus sp. BC26 TaxID=1881032 RepID=UPI0008F08314|nr:class I SAM-dependent methyltransferase [Paenibacillus sp. BC26]SFS47984.1 Methyltransferase domain-containing protein [Paenibacillus sp. BC26]